jgi:hypothetical protein
MHSDTSDRKKDGTPEQAAEGTVVAGDTILRTNI